MTKLVCRDHKSVDNAQIESNSADVGKMTDICEAGPDAASPCGRESMFGWMEVW